MYAKLINNTLESAPKKVNHNGYNILNPPESVLLALGYLPVTYTDMPDNPPDGQHYESAWTQTDTAIVQVWNLADDPIYPDPEPNMNDFVAAIERGLTT